MQNEVSWRLWSKMETQETPELITPHRGSHTEQLPLKEIQKLAE